MVQTHNNQQAAAHSIRARPLASQMPQIAASKVSWLQQLLMDAGFPLIGGADNDYGSSTHEAARHIAGEAHLDLHTVNFNDPASDNYKTFIAAIAAHKKAHDPVVTQLATPHVVPVPAQAPAPVVAQPDPAAGIPASIRGTQYDPRHLAQVSDAELNNILKDGLHSLGEITGGIFGSYHRNGQLGTVTTAKVFEQERKLLGLTREEQTLDRRALEDVAAAMGQKIAAENGLAPRGNAPVDANINPTIAGTQYDPRALAAANPTELLAIIKDGLLAKHEISRGERNDPFFAQTKEFEREVFKQERKLGLTAPGHETMDPAVLRRLAAELGQDAAEATRLTVNPALVDAANLARTAGALPTQGAVTNGQQASMVQNAPTQRGPIDLLPPGYQR